MPTYYDILHKNAYRTQDRLADVLRFTENRRKDVTRSHKTIYIIRCNEFYKIGYATNFKERLFQYKVHNPFPIEVIATATTGRYKSFENYVLRRYRELIVHGEWLRLTHNDINYIRRKWFV